MAMYLARIPIFTIMLLGHWSSDAFLRYIRKEVQEFSSSVSSKMIHQGNFYTIQQKTNTVTAVVPDHPNSAMRHKLGPKFRDALMPLVRSFQMP
jgi:hypothetical protein